MHIRLLAIGLIAGLLAACTSGEDPRPSPTPTTSVQPVTTEPQSPAPTTRTGPLTTGPNVRPGEKLPEYPDLARHHTANGALAFAWYFYAAYDCGYATNDPYLVQRISDLRCTGCSKYIASLESLRASGGVLHGGRITVLSRGLRHGEFNYESDYVAEVVLNETPIVIDRPNQSRTTAAPAVQHYSQYLFISWEGDGWKIVEVAGDA